MNIYKLPRRTKAELYRELDEYRIAVVRLNNKLYAQRFYKQGLLAAEVEAEMDKISGWLTVDEGDEIQYIITPTEGGRVLLVPISHYSWHLIEENFIRAFQGTQEYVDSAILMDCNPQYYFLEPDPELEYKLKLMAEQHPSLLWAFGVNPKLFTEEDKES